MTTHVSLTRLGIQEWHQGIPSASLTLRRIARCLWPRQRSRAWKIDSDGTHIGPQTLGRPAAFTRSDRRDGDGKAPGKSITRANQNRPNPITGCGQ